MANYVASCVFLILDVLITIPACLITMLIDYATRTATADQDTTLAECSYRLDSSTPSTLRLPDSRILSYAQFGSTSPTAKTIFFLHGFPGSRIEGAYLDKPARAKNIRVISVDRPGTGQSTPDLNRTVLSHAKDIEHLAQHLNAEEYGVLGVSGGGPYALACAKALPADRLKVVTIVCGLGPSDIGYWGMYIMNYLGWTLAPHYTPRLMRWWLSREPVARLDLSRKQRMDILIQSFEKSQPRMPPKDVAFFGDVDVMKVQLRTGEEAFAQGTWYALQDMKLLASDLGFKIEDIRKDLPVQLLYGRLDRNVPLTHGVEVARRLRGEDDDGRVSLRIEEHDTHASIFFDYRDEFLDEMVKRL
ncbi:alpha/beta hydrolase fold protein [Pochonia chlamydosporia 170]|uniref:Alpha/beta hydrolase fold protein n=1 Tax=Pochonia chlamydosporia 170 TaxID=1380566 RepID=A0A179FBD9_METCM|nr:alpha/beta hydrolase fold protein [Pochonia chlamydosporia 170]OAQ62737.1 alpha/beta hydrolase fold protein [Pochonia chlamydosporia 170]